MSLTNNYVWIAPIAISIFNGIVIQRTSQSQILWNKELEKGYKKIFFYTIVYANIPWFIMGIGNILGLSNVSDYIKVDIHNPVVLTFYLSILILFGFLIKWVYFGDGAEFIQRHPMNRGFFSEELFQLSASQIKILFGFIIIIASISIIILWIRSR